MSSHHGIPPVEEFSVGFGGERGVGIGMKRAAFFAIFESDQAFSRVDTVCGVSIC